MSYIFDVGDETIWSPSLRTGRLYVGLTNCLADIAGHPTGLTAIAEDMYEIDPQPFEALVKLVYKDFFSTSNPVYRSQLRGWLLTSLVLLTRADISITPTSDDERDLFHAIDTHAKAMPS